MKVSWKDIQYKQLPRFKLKKMSRLFAYLNLYFHICWIVCLPIDTLYILHVSGPAFYFVFVSIFTLITTKIHIRPRKLIFMSMKNMHSLIYNFFTNKILKLKFLNQMSPNHNLDIKIRFPTPKTTRNTCVTLIYYFCKKWPFLTFGHFGGHLGKF